MRLMTKSIAWAMQFEWVLLIISLSLAVFAITLKNYPLAISWLIFILVVHVVVISIYVEKLFDLKAKQNKLTVGRGSAQCGSVGERMNGIAFGIAIEALKRGDKVARAGWNGKGMFVYYVPANSYLAQTGAAKSHFGEGGMVPYNAYLAIKNVNETVSTWVPSINDVLAEDWIIIE